MQVDPAHLPRVKREQKRMNPSAFTAMLAAMIERPCSVAYLSEITGLHEWTIRNYAKSLVVGRVAHIAGWEKDSMGRDVTALYKFGFGVNMPRTHKTGAQKQRESRAKARRIAQELNAN